MFLQASFNNGTQRHGLELDDFWLKSANSIQQLDNLSLEEKNCHVKAAFGFLDSNPG